MLTNLLYVCFPIYPFKIFINYILMKTLTAHSVIYFVPVFVLEKDLINCRNIDVDIVICSEHKFWRPSSVQSDPLEAEEVFHSQQGLHRVVAVRLEAVNLKRIQNWGAAIAQWIRLCLPSCCPEFESQADHLHFYHL